MMSQAHLTCDYYTECICLAWRCRGGNERSENSTPPAAAATTTVRVTRPQCRHLSPPAMVQPHAAVRPCRLITTDGFSLPRVNSSTPRENGVIAVTPPTTRARFGRQRHAHYPHGDIKLYEKTPRFAYPILLLRYACAKYDRKKVSRRDLYYCGTTCAVRFLKIIHVYEKKVL